MLNEIDKIHPDAIIVDYQLNDKKEDIRYNVCYNGVELLNAIHNQLSDFPSFVLTSYDGEAVEDSDDVNFVYVKRFCTFLLLMAKRYHLLNELKAR